MKKKTLICTLCAGILILAATGTSLVFASSQAQMKTGQKGEQKATLKVTEERKADDAEGTIQKSDNGQSNADKNTLEPEAEFKPTLQETNEDSASGTKALKEQPKGNERVQTVEKEITNEAEVPEQNSEDYVLVKMDSCE